MIKRLLLLTLMLLILLAGLERAYGYFLRRNVNLKSSYVASHRIDADVVFLGPCEPLWMMDPEVFQKYTGLKGYNLSTVHANFAENETMLHLYLSRNKAPRFIFLYVTTESVDGAFNVFNTYSFAQLLDNDFVREKVQEQDTAFCKWKSFPFMRYAYYSNFVNFNCLQGMKHALTGRQNPYFSDGFVRPHGIVWDGRYERFVKEFPAGRVFHWNPEEVKHLTSLLKEARRQGSEVIFYESPMLNEIKPFILNRQEIKEKITKLAGENEVPYWVFDTMKISDSRSNYFSILNTNEKGSAVFNETFANYFLDWEQRRKEKGKH
jgi:hypothetical protein